MLCPVCQKVSRNAGVRKLLRGNYNPTTTRKRHPNLQWISLPGGRRMRVCTSCKRKATQDPSYLVKKGVVTSRA